MSPGDFRGTMLLNRYKVVEKIGGGGMSVVWKAYDLVLDRHVALKVLRPEMSEDEEFVRRFRREAQSAASLSHPNIVSIYDVGQDRGLHFIVMELVEGETLRDKLKREGRLSLPDALDIAGQICEGLAHAHARRIIHRDIKPQNILITSRGLVKVTDFGIARALGGISTTARDVVVGSIPYMSPEQAKNGTVSARSDLYSLGVVLYEMLSGRPPFIGDSPVAIAVQHAEAKVPSLCDSDPSIPASVDLFVQKALAKDPENRFQSAEEMLEAIYALRAEIGASSPSEAGKAVSRYSSQTPVSRGGTDMGRAGKPKAGMSLAAKIFIALIGVVFALSAYALYLFNRWMAVPILEVPNVVGKTQMEAQQILKDAGFIFRIAAERYDSEVPAGVVISQSPMGGEKAKKDREVYCVISKGDQYTKVPDVRGKTQREAELELNNQGLQLGNVRLVSHPTIPKDRVVNQNPKGGTEVAKGTLVDLEVSKGPEGSTVKVPSVVGLTLEKAQQTLNDALLETGSVTRMESQEASGTVLAQNPAPGAEVPWRSKVDLIVSGGKETAYVESKSITVPSDAGEPGKPTNVRIVVVDSDGERVVFDKNLPAGTRETVTFQWRGTQVVIRTYFNGKLYQEEVKRAP